MNRLTIIAGLCAAGASSYAYLPVMLHSAAVPGLESAAYGVGDGQQVGNANPFNPNPRALLWSGTAKSVIDLTPAGYSVSLAKAVHGGKQYGSAHNPSLQQTHPLIWNGSANDYENLFVANLGGHNFQRNEMEFAFGDQQVGSGTPYASAKNNFDPGPRAMMWHGTAASAQLLHPDHLDLLESVALGTDGKQQVGWGFGTSASPGQFAMLWNGTPGSAVKLNPLGSNHAAALGVANGHQVGRVSFGFSGPQAALWHGSATSFVNLTPKGHVGWASGTNGTYQVGSLASPATADLLRATRWSGDIESMYNLHQLLPLEWAAVESQAFGIDLGGNIVGSFRDAQGWRAVMWVVPEPGTIAALAAGIGLLLARRKRQ